jgi:hypothetical protein
VKATVLTTFWGGSAAPGDTGGHFIQYGSDTVGSGGGMYGAWSLESLNSGPISDRAVTFDMQGLDVYTWLAGNASNPNVALLNASGGYPAYIVAFETGSDGDYQDMLILLQAIKPIPAPGSIVLGGIGLLFVGWLRRRQIAV